jgi:hypothetical protein
MKPKIPVFYLQYDLVVRNTFQVVMQYIHDRYGVSSGKLKKLRGTYFFFTFAGI